MNKKSKEDVVIEIRLAKIAIVFSVLAVALSILAVFVTLYPPPTPTVEVKEFFTISGGFRDFPKYAVVECEEGVGVVSYPDSVRVYGYDGLDEDGDPIGVSKRCFAKYKVRMT